LNALEFLGVFEQLAREAGFVASEDVKGVGLVNPRSGLGDHHFHAIVVVRVRGVPY
jgi:hypothetical protein